MQLRDGVLKSQAIAAQSYRRYLQQRVAVNEEIELLRQAYAQAEVEEINLFSAGLV